MKLDPHQAGLRASIQHLHDVALKAGYRGIPPNADPNYASLAHDLVVACRSAINEQDNPQPFILPIGIAYDLVRLIKESGR